MQVWNKFLRFCSDSRARVLRGYLWLLSDAALRDSGFSGLFEWVGKSIAGKLCWGITLLDALVPYLELTYLSVAALLTVLIEIE